MATQFTIPAIALSAGPHSAVAAVPKGATSYSVSLDTTQHLNTGVSLHVITEVSADGGATWVTRSDATIPGGVLTGDNGQALTTHDESGPLGGDPSSSTRQVRVTVIPIGGSFISSGGQVTIS